MIAGQDGAAPPPPVDPPTPDTATVSRCDLFHILLVKGSEMWDVTEFGRSFVCKHSDARFQRFCTPGQEQLTLFLANNPECRVANIASAASASFIFSREAADTVTGLATFTAWAGARIAPMVLNMEAAEKPTPTENQKMDKLREQGHWFTQEPVVPWPTDSRIEAMTYVEARELCVAKTLSATGTLQVATRHTRRTCRAGCARCARAPAAPVRPLHPLHPPRLLPPSLC